MIEILVILGGVIVSLLIGDWIRLRKERLARLQDSESPLPKEKTETPEISRLLDIFPGPAFSISKDGTILRINSAASKIFPDRLLKDRNYQAIFLEAALLDSIQKALATWEPLSTVIRLPPNSPFSKNRSNKESHWEIDLSPVNLIANTHELQVMLRDVTAGIETEQVRQDFVANASHELRTPLSIISGYLENLIEDDVVADPALSKKILTTMSRHVDRINHIVEDMLVISKLESEEGMPLNIEPFSFGPCVRDVVERLEPLIEDQNAEIIIDVPELTIEGDRFYWTQILFNLVENALKQNASTEIKVEINAQQLDDGQIKIQIRDNGIGIPSGDLPFIFKRFFRVEKHHSQTQIKGTGLGLSIVKRAVEAHEGKISATSTPGVETIFTITIPNKVHSPKEKQASH